MLPITSGTAGFPRRLLSMVAALLAVLLVAGSLVAYLKFRSVWDSISRVAVTGLGDRPPKVAGAMNVLLIGSDSRAGTNGQFGTGITGQRSDTIIVLHLTPGDRSAVVLSIPRDSVVPVLYCPPEAGTTGQAAQPGQVEQINATFAYGGPGCLWKTIEQTTHLRLDHFIELDFTGFEHVINDIGGVSICLPFSVSDPGSRLYLGAGRHHVWGAQALAFWRARYIGEGSDLQRIQRDQFLMASLLQGVEHADLLASPSRLLSVVSDVARSMTTDSGLGLSTLLSIGTRLRSLQAGNVQFIELPTADYGPDPNWVTWPPSDAQLFSAIAHDRAVPAATTASAARPAPASSAGAASSQAGFGDIEVQVLNGAGIVGLAQQAAQALAGHGVQVAGIGYAASSAHQASVVEYPAADLPAARDLESLLGGGTLVPDPALQPGAVTVIVGADYAFRHPVPADTVSAGTGADGTSDGAPSSASTATSGPPAASGGLVSKYGGITGNANVCHDSQAFTGPRGGT